MKKPLIIITLVVAIAGAVAGFSYERANASTLADYAKVKFLGFESEISSSTRKNLEINDDALLILDSTKAKYLNAESFAKACPVKEKTIVLGCYYKNQIFVYNIKEKKLNGVVEVTLVHELLHAYYERLSNAEKNQVNSLLKTAEAKVKDKRILGLLKNYKSDPDTDYYNEVHSILGTEVKEIGSELEAHYGKVLKDREKIVNLSLRYETVFLSLENKASKILKTLESLKKQIQDTQSGLESSGNLINENKSTLNSLEADINNTNDVDQKNTLISQFNNLLTQTKSEIDSYNADVANFNKTVDRYNKLRLEYNTLITSENKLIKSLDYKNEL